MKTILKTLLTLIFIIITINCNANTYGEKEYSIKNGTIYYETKYTAKILYGNDFRWYNYVSKSEKGCFTLYPDGNYKYVSDIITENNNYLIFNVISGYCAGCGTTTTYVLDKNTDISRKINLNHRLSEFNSISEKNININDFNGWALGSGGEIQKKGFYDNYNCPECGIKFNKTKKISFLELEKYYVKGTELDSKYIDKKDFENYNFIITYDKMGNKVKKRLGIYNTFSKVLTNYKNKYKNNIKVLNIFKKIEKIIDNFEGSSGQYSYRKIEKLREKYKNKKGKNDIIVYDVLDYFIIYYLISGKTTEL